MCHCDYGQRQENSDCAKNKSDCTLSLLCLLGGNNYYIILLPDWVDKLWVILFAIWHSTKKVTTNQKKNSLDVFINSVRLNERKQRGVDNNKKMAYLVDLKTITVGE